MKEWAFGELELGVDSLSAVQGTWGRPRLGGTSER